jgi:hypothetical protein
MTDTYKPGASEVDVYRMTKPENPQAFPFETGQFQEYGMTLRDYFAGQVLAGSTTDECFGVASHLSGEVAAEKARMDAARWCYQMADAMLKARGDSDA